VSTAWDSKAKLDWDFSHGHLILNQLLGDDYPFPALMHAIWRLSSITACGHCFAAAVASIFPWVRRFPDPHSQVANARTIKGGWEFNCVLWERAICKKEV
jgi:hypothetical protein